MLTSERVWMARPTPVLRGLFALLLFASPCPCALAQEILLQPQRLSEHCWFIQGEPGSKIAITVAHEGTRQTETVTVARAMIEVQTILGIDRRADNPHWRSATVLCDRLCMRMQASLRT